MNTMRSNERDVQASGGLSRCAPIRMGARVAGMLVSLILGGLGTSASAATQTYTEDFTTTSYEDAVNTTADWNTTDEELKLFAAPSFAGSYDTPGLADGVAVAGDHAFVADGTSGLQVIDISDPTNPTLAGTYDTPGNARRVAVAGNHAFVADGDVGLQVIDITDPTSPALAGTYDRRWEISLQDLPEGVEHS